MDFSGLVPARPGCSGAEIKRSVIKESEMRVIIFTLAALLLPAAWAEEYPPRPWAVSEQRAPCDHYSPERQAFFGDTHVHTAFSLDAGVQNTRNRPDDAYRFARGERVGLQPYDEQGEPLRSARLERSLDFTVVTDHGEALGMVGVCTIPGYEGYDTFMCRTFRNSPDLGFFLMIRFPIVSRHLASRYPILSFLKRFTDHDAGLPSFCGDGGVDCYRAGKTRWENIQAAAERAYDRSSACSFTSFIGYEWSGNAETNLHRNVIFRNERVVELPISYVETATPEELWRELQDQCISRTDGCDALAIPHNSNLSAGSMFRGPETETLSAAAAKFRAELEPILEVMQHKGDSECWYGPGGSPDELCAFEKLPYSLFSGRFMPLLAEPVRPEYGFARRILADGLRHEARSGENPYRMGFIGSTDTHLGTPGAAEEWKHQGHGGAGKAAASGLPVGLPDDIENNPGGLAVLWAEENTRDALFAAMKRRETFGTSGPRMKVRFFGGWQYSEDLCQSPDFVQQGYGGGVPMGGVLPAAAGSSAPRFAVRALRDPGTVAHPGMPLQRLQVIKGWVDDTDVAREQVYEVAGNPDNGARVDTATCEARGAGFDQLCAVWSDPDFKVGQRTYYYARAVENPSCRWSQYICNARGVDCTRPETVGKGLEGCCEAEHRPVIQERAWTSPIWYRPPS